jgi:N-acetylneuraminic acid mutarotase
MSHVDIGGKIFLFGGEHGHHGLGANDDFGYIQHKYTWEYDPANDSWRRRADMPVGVSHLEGNTLAINGKAVLIGGLLDGGSPNQTSRVTVYDPVANTWKTLATRYPKRIIGSESGYWNGKIYITDGFSPDTDDRSAGFEGTVKFV